MDTEQLKKGDYFRVLYGEHKNRIGIVRYISDYIYFEYRVTIFKGNHTKIYIGLNRRFIKKLTDEEVMLWKLSN